MKGEHVKDAAQGVAEGVMGDMPQDVAQDLAFGPGRRVPSSPLATTAAAAVFAHAEIGAQLGSSVAFGSGCGGELPGVPRKAPLCLKGSSYLLGTALPDLKGALCEGFCDSRVACISAVLFVDPQKRQWPENGQLRASSIKAALNAPVSCFLCQHPVPSGT